MAYGKLSDLVNRVSEPQQTDTFVKLFKAAVRDGRIEAMALPTRFTLPKQFRRRGMSTEFQSRTAEMVYEDKPEVEAWFEETNRALMKARHRKRKVKPSIEAVEAGEIDFAAAAAETRRKLNTNYERGRVLGGRQKRKENA